MLNSLHPAAAPVARCPEDFPLSADVTPPAAAARHPIAIWFFFWGEFAERCSYYGMRAILPLYLTTKLGLPDEKASQWYYLFKMGCYFLPLLGGWLADRYLGKYWTIVGFSVPYVIAQLLIGIENDWVVMLALALCAMGSGVIKPNISALMGLTYDQQRPGNGPLRASAFLWFYFAVNVGALISLFALPLIRDDYGYQVAFLVPAGFMAVALAIFALGKSYYATETVGPPPPMTAEQRAEQQRTITRLLGVFGLTIFFWVVYEHNDTQWTFFARDYINRWMPDWAPTWLRGGKRLAADQFQFINALCVLLMIVFFQWFWKRVDPTGKRVPHTTKILLGFVFTGAGPAIMALAAASAANAAPAVTAAAEKAAVATFDTQTSVGAAAFASPAVVVATTAEAAGDREKVSMLWIVAAYVLLTLGEVLLYGTMLDLSYAYAPARMKGFITACFLVTNALGNLINSQYASTYNTVMSPQVFFALDAAMCVGAAIAFFFVGRQFNRSNAAAAA